RGLDSTGNDVLQQAAHADASDLLVVRQREMQRTVEAAAYELRDEREPDRRKALHVGDAAPVQAVPLDRRGEWIGIPGLDIDGNDIGMAGKDDAGGGASALH